MIKIRRGNSKQINPGKVVWGGTRQRPFLKKFHGALDRMCGAGASVEVLCCVVALVHKCRGASKQVCEDLQTILQTSLRILNKDAMDEGHWIQRNSDSRIAFDGDLRVHI